jgi:hypothetical protein
MKLWANIGLCSLIKGLMVPDFTIKLTNLPNLQDLMHSNIKSNFGTSSSSGDMIVLCRVLWWGVKSDYAGMPYNVVIGANVVVSPYDLVALAQMFHELNGLWTRVYILVKTPLAGPHVAFEGEMARLFARVHRINRMHSRLRSPGVFIIVADGKR